jgi:hypothetical protein
VRLTLDLEQISALQLQLSAASMCGALLAEPKLKLTHAAIVREGDNVLRVTPVKRTLAPSGSPDASMLWFDLQTLKAQLMQREITLRDMKIAREAGESIAKEVVDDMLATLSQKLDLLLRLKLEVELGQRVIGKNAAEVNVEGGVILDEIREVINSNIALFQTDAVSWPRS